MSQADLAARTGLSVRTIGNYERGRTPEDGIAPDGYYDVARALGWKPESIDALLRGGAPLEAASPPAPSDVESLIAPAWDIADAARDMGAPTDLVDRFRTSAVALLGWMSAQADQQPRAVGEGVAPEDREEVLRAAEGDK